MLYSAKYVAEKLGCGQRQVTNYCRAGKIKAVRIGNLWKIPEEELDYVIKNGTRKTEKEA